MDTLARLDSFNQLGHFRDPHISLLKLQNKPNGFKGPESKTALRV